MQYFEYYEEEHVSLPGVKCLTFELEIYKMHVLYSYASGKVVEGFEALVKIAEGWLRFLKSL